MAVYAEEEEVFKCPNHPSKRRRNGICSICLRDRLIALCPDCRNARPCSCSLITATSSSSSASSSFSLFSSSGRCGSARSSNVAASTSYSNLNLIDGEPPSFLRSRSLAIPFFRTKVPVGDSCEGTPAMRKSSFWRGFRKEKRTFEEDFGDRRSVVVMGRSHSVSVLASRDYGDGDGDGKSLKKGRGWYFPSPMSVFRQSKPLKLKRGC